MFLRNQRLVKQHNQEQNDVEVGNIGVRFGGQLRGQRIILQMSAIPNLGAAGCC